MHKVMLEAEQPRCLRWSKAGSAADQYVIGEQSCLTEVGLQASRAMRYEDMFPWYSSAMLAFESSHVISLRLMKFSLGGPDANYEANLMVTEKIAASFEAAVTLAKSGDILMVVDHYRKHVAANVARLTPG
jgi:hypothetical protein